MQVLKEIGEGPESVYAYYFPRDYQPGFERWPHKIGRSKNDPFVRIKEQQASMQEEPIVSLLVHCPDSMFTEAFLHSFLIPHKLNSYGREWFNVNPGEIEEALPGSIDEVAILQRSQPIHLQISTLRVAQGLKQAEFADRAGMARATVIYVEKGKSVRFSTIATLADALGMRLTLTPKD